MIILKCKGKVIPNKEKNMKMKKVSERKIIPERCKWCDSESGHQCGECEKEISKTDCESYQGLCYECSLNLGLK
jgi:hypothetical protein